MRNCICFVYNQVWQVSRIRWVVHVKLMDAYEVTKRIVGFNPRGVRSRGSPELRLMSEVSVDLLCGWSLVTRIQG